MKKIFLSFFILFNLLFLSSTSMAGNVMDYAMGDGIRVAYYNWDPYGYVDANGELVGTDYETLQHVIGEMGGKIASAEDVEWGALIPGLKSGRFDVVSAGMFVTPKRCKAVHFSSTVFGIRNTMLVQKGNPKGVTDYESIRDKGLTVTALGGSAQIGYAKSVNIPDSNIVELPDLATMIEAIRSGRVDAIGGTTPAARAVLATNDDIEATPAFTEIGGKVNVSHGAFAFPQGNEDFVSAFNAILDAYIGSDAHKALFAKHGMTPDEQPVSSTAELCAK